MLKEVDSNRLRVYVIWERLLNVDDYALAQELAAELPDRRAVHYWEPSQVLGWEYGKQLPFPKEYQYEFAVDVFLLFDPGVEWSAVSAPVPGGWLHRLGEDERKFDREKLRKELEKRLGGTAPGAAPVMDDLVVPAVPESPVRAAKRFGE